MRRASDPRPAGKAERTPTMQGAGTGASVRPPDPPSVPQPERRSRAGRFLLGTAAFVIVVAGMRAAADIIVPFLLAAILSVICSAPLGWLQRKRIPTPLAVLLVVIGLLAIGLVIGTLVGTSLVNFTASLPSYQARLQLRVAGIVDLLRRLGLDVNEDLLLQPFNVKAVLPIAARTLAALTSVVTNTALIVITMVFILLEMSSFPVKMAAAFGSDRSVLQFRLFATSVKRYLAIKTAISLATGIGVAIWLTVLGVDYPLLWGLLAFVLNYVPNIGSFIAAIPAVLLALIQLGTGPMLLAALGYLVVNTIMGNFVEPRVMGRGVGLSTLVVFLSLLFWGWVLGPVGMLLSVPLTMIVKIALESGEDTNKIAILLGSRAAAEAVT